MSSITDGLSPPTINDGWPDPQCPPYLAPRLHLDVHGDIASTPGGESCRYSIVQSGGINYSVVEIYMLDIEIDTAGTTITMDGNESAQLSGSSSGTCTRALTASAAKQ
jgi:hypothetical protein